MAGLLPGDFAVAIAASVPSGETSLALEWGWLWLTADVDDVQLGLSTGCSLPPGAAVASILAVLCPIL